MSVSVSDLEAALGSSDQCVAVAKTKDFLRVIHIGFDPRGDRKRFYEGEGLKKIVCSVFGEPASTSPAVKVAWLELGTGHPFVDYKHFLREARSGAVFQRGDVAKCKSVLDLLDLLDVEADAAPSLYACTSHRKNISFPFSMFPTAVHRDFARSGGQDLLLQLLVYRDSMAPPPTGPAYRVGQDLLSLTLKDYVLFSFLRYPNSTTRARRSTATSSSSQAAAAARGAAYGVFEPRGPGGTSQGTAGSQPSSSSSGSKPKEPPSFLYSAVSTLTAQAPHGYLLWFYLQHFLPRPSQGPALPNSMSDIFFVAAMYFFLRQNEAVNTDPSAMMASPMRASSASATFDGQYVQPTREGLTALSITLTYLFNSQGSNGVSCLQVLDTPVSPPQPMALRLSHAYGLQYFLYQFFKVNMDLLVEPHNFSLFSQVVDCWLQYLTPWRASEREGGKVFVPTSSSRKAPTASASALSQLAAMVTPGGSATGGDGGVTAGAGAGSTVGASDKGIPGTPGGPRTVTLAVAAGAGAGEGGEEGSSESKPVPSLPVYDFASGRHSDYDTKWEPFVAGNYLLYMGLLSSVLKRVSRCDFSSDQAAVDLLERVMDVYEKCVVGTLQSCSAIIDPEKRKSTRGRSRDLYLKGLLEAHATTMRLRSLSDMKQASFNNVSPVANKVLDRMSAGIAMAASGSSFSAKSQQERANARLFNKRGPSGRNYCDGFIERVLRFVVARFSTAAVDDGAAALAQKLSRVVSAGSRVGAVFSLHASVASLNAEMAGAKRGNATPKLGPLPPGRHADDSDDGSKTVGQLVWSGRRRCTPLDVGFQGPEGSEPLGTYESEVLLRVAQRVAVFLTCLFGPTPSPTVDYYKAVEEIDKAQQSVYETIDSGEVDTSDKLMRRLASVQGPPKTFLRVFADVRVFTLCCLLFFLVTMPALGAGPTAAISALFAVSCRLLL